MKCTSEKIDVRKAVLYWVLTVGYMSLIFYLSSQSFSLPELPKDSDKVIHAIIYFPLAFLIYRSLWNCRMKKYIFVIAFILAGIYGISDEFHQSFVPGRDSSLGDAAADFVGALLGSLGASIFRT